MPRLNKDIQESEQEAAAAILIFDLEEIQTFDSTYTGTFVGNDVETSGNFIKFLDFVREAIKNDIFLENESNRDSLINFIRLHGEMIPKADEQYKFVTWFDEVTSKEIPSDLAQDIIDRYIWQDIKRKMEAIDNSDMSYADKLSARPKPIEVNTTKSKLIGLDEISLELDSMDNKKYTTGLPFLDESLQLSGTNFFVVGARPGVGKTLFMLQQAIENARGGAEVGPDRVKLKPKKTLFISLEMSDKAIHDRVFGYLQGENLKELSQSEYVQTSRKIQENEDFKNVLTHFKVLVSESSNASSILDEVERYIDSEGIEAVFIDYLQLLKFSDARDEWASIRKATKELKNLAFRKKILVVTATQVSRDSTERGLELTSLFGGQSIESDADSVIGLEALSERRPGTANSVSLKILKNREGELREFKTLIDYSTSNIQVSDDDYGF